MYNEKGNSSYSNILYKVNYIEKAQIEMINCWSKTLYSDCKASDVNEYDCILVYHVLDVSTR